MNMMFLLPSLLFIFFLLLIKHYRKSKLPPGPPKLPLIGNLHQILVGSGSTPLHHTLTNLARKHGPIMHLSLGQVPTIIISSPKAAQHVLKTHELSFAQRPMITAVDLAAYGDSSIVFCPYGNYWRQVRKICMIEIFSARRVKSFSSMREEEMWNIIETISSFPRGHGFNLSEKIFSFTSSITSRAAFGNKCRHAEDFLGLLDELNELSAEFDFPDIFPSLKFFSFVWRKKASFEKLHLRIEKVLNNIIDDHRVKNRAGDSDTVPRGEDDDDLLDLLLRQQENENDPEFSITPRVLKAIILDIFGGGTESSATTIEWAMSEMLRNPRIMEKAQAEVRQVLGGKKKFKEEDIQNLKYMKLVIMETLRLHPPFPLSTRESMKGSELDGFEIPMRAKIVLNIWSIGRDPLNHGPDADCFRPERFDGSSISYKGTHFEYIPFGSGRRICPGISFAIATIECALAYFLYYLDWKLQDGIEPEKLDMTESIGVTAKKKHAVYVIATPYRPPLFDTLQE